MCYSCSKPTAPVSESRQNQTRTQKQYCTSVPKQAKSDTHAVNARADCALACETRVESTLCFQLKRVSAPNCFRALRSMRESRSSRCPVTKKRHYTLLTQKAYCASNKKGLQARKLEAPFLYQTSVTQLRRRNHPDHPDHQGNHLD